MSYTSKTLSVLGYANGFTLWHYSTPDVASSVKADGYFNAGADMLRVGDFILANTGVQREVMPGPNKAYSFEQTKSAAQHGIFVVASSQNGQVALADLTPTGSDADSQPEAETPATEAVAA